MLRRRQGTATSVSSDLRSSRSVVPCGRRKNCSVATPQIRSRREATRCRRDDVVASSVVVGYSGALQPGETLGKYEIVRELALGGMARIYLARVCGTAGFEKQVVLKCILESIATDDQFVTMFLDEARLAATLRHSNIADVIDVGVERGIHYFAMEYVAGKTARDIRIRGKELRNPPPLEISLAIISGTAAALEYAHTRVDVEGKSIEIVHRD